MDVKFISELDNRSAYDANAVTELTEIGMPANTMRDFFVRIGNVSGEALSNVLVRTEGQHASRLMLSFNEHGQYADELALTELQDGASKNLYLRLTMPLTVPTEEVTTYVVVGTDRLPLRYNSAESCSALFDPYPLYEGDFTDQIFELFEGKPVHRFVRYDPVENYDEETNAFVGTIRKGQVFDIRLCDHCVYVNPNNHQYGYEAPITKDITCIPTPREITSVRQWQDEGQPYDYGDNANIFLRPDFLNEMGASMPLWRAAIRHNPPYLSPADDPSYTLYKRTHFLMLRQGYVYHVDHLHAVMRGQEIAYYSATLKLVFEAESSNEWRYNPFAQLYGDQSDIVVQRVACRAIPQVETLADSGSGSGSAVPQSVIPPCPECPECPDQETAPEPISATYSAPSLTVTYNMELQSAALDADNWLMYFSGKVYTVDGSPQASGTTVTATMQWNSQYTFLSDRVIYDPPPHDVIGSNGITVYAFHNFPLA